MKFDFRFGTKSRVVFTTLTRISMRTPRITAGSSVTAFGMTIPEVSSLPYSTITGEPGQVRHQDSPGQITFRNITCESMMPKSRLGYSQAYIRSL